MHYHMSLFLASLAGLLVIGYCKPPMQFPCHDLDQSCVKGEVDCRPNSVDGPQRCPCLCKAPPVKNTDDYMRNCCQINGMTEGCVQLCRRNVTVHEAAVIALKECNPEHGDGQIWLDCARTSRNIMACCREKGAVECYSTICRGVAPARDLAGFKCVVKWADQLKQCLLGDPVA